MMGCCHPPDGVSRRRAATGFSLIEVLVVLALVLALGAVGVPVMLAAADDAAVGQAQEVFHRVVRRAQVLASDSGGTVVVRVSARGDRVEIANAASEPVEAGLEEGVAPEVLDDFGLPDGVSVGGGEGPVLALVDPERGVVGVEGLRVVVRGQTLALRLVGGPEAAVIERVPPEEAVPEKEEP